MLDADGDDFAFESPTVDEPVADGFELELALPPRVEPSVVDEPLALEPPPELLSDELADAVALEPVVLPFVVDAALDPELLTVAAPVELGDASALELPVVAALLSLTETWMLPPFALMVLVVDGDWLALEPACEPLPLCDGETVEVLLPPDAVPEAVGELWMFTLPPLMLLVDDGDEVAVEFPTWELPFALGEELDVADPPVVLPLVFEFALALEPPPPLLFAVAPAPPVVPVVEVCAAEPEPLTTPVASANAGETPATTSPATATPAIAEALAPLSIVCRSYALRLKDSISTASLNLARTNCRSVDISAVLCREAIARIRKSGSKENNIKARADGSRWPESVSGCLVFQRIQRWTSSPRLRTASPAPR